jgi:hypothetical protein
MINNRTTTTVELLNKKKLLRYERNFSYIEAMKDNFDNTGNL